MCAIKMVGNQQFLRHLAPFGDEMTSEFHKSNSDSTEKNCFSKSLTTTVTAI